MFIKVGLCILGVKSVSPPEDGIVGTETCRSLRKVIAYCVIVYELVLLYIIVIYARTRYGQR
jgi:hypothetical protein